MQQAQQQALSDAQLLELAGEESLECIKELTLRNRQLSSFEQLAARLPHLQALSLSHNHITTLAGFQTLAYLVTLNINANALTSLDGIQGCTALQHLYVASNRIRDPSPLAACAELETVHLFGNAISDLDLVVMVMGQLPKLRDLELGGNPCAVAAGYKQQLVGQLQQLHTLDGETIVQLDRDLAYDFYATHPSADAQVLTLDGAPCSAPAAVAAVDRTSAGSTAPCAADRVDSSTSAGLGPGSLAVAQPMGLPPRPGSAVQLPRPGTALVRPGSSSGRPTTPGGTQSVQLLRDEILNDHPYILEYLAKHVLTEGAALVHAGDASGAMASGKGASFAQRLRHTAAAMSACEGMDAAVLVGQPDLIASASSARKAAAEQLVVSASMHDLCRQLIKLCEALIRELELSRQGRPSSSSSSSGRPGTALGPKPPSKGNEAPTGTTHNGATEEEVHLRAEVEVLLRQNKALQLENNNMYWLAEEVKRLKAELALARGAGSG